MELELGQGWMAKEPSFLCNTCYPISGSTEVMTLNRKDFQEESISLTEISSDSFHLRITVEQNKSALQKTIFTLKSR